MSYSFVLPLPWLSLRLVIDLPSWSLNVCHLSWLLPSKPGSWLRNLPWFNPSKSLSWSPATCQPHIPCGQSFYLLILQATYHVSFHLQYFWYLIQSSVIFPSCQRPWPRLSNQASWSALAKTWPTHVLPSHPCFMGFTDILLMLWWWMCLTLVGTWLTTFFLQENEKGVEITIFRLFL